VFNEDQVDHDFRVEGNDFANMIMVDASRNTMGFFITASNNYGFWISQGAHQPDDNQDYSRVRMNAQAAVTINTSTTSSYVDTLAVQEPIITAAGDGSSGTVTIASSLRIQSAPTEAPNADSTIQNNYGLYVQSGMTRLTEGAIIGNTNDLNQQLDDSSHGDGTVALFVGNAQLAVTSDERLKTEIRPTAIKALSLVDEFKVVDFGWDDPSDTVEYGKNYRGRYTGMLAQDTIKIAPWIINDQGGGRDCNQCMSGDECDDHGMWQVEYQHLVPTLVKAIQELSEKIQELEHGNR
jgi:hypothetical protein